MITIVEDLLLSGWRSQTIDMPRHTHLNCPACRASISPLAAVNTPQGSMTVSECVTCGWLGYADPPSDQWWESFYAGDWDAHGRSMAAHISFERVDVHPLAQWVRQEFPDPDRQPVVLDFGCGFGLALHQLRQAGYKRICGIETCSHRRAYAQSQGLNVGASLADFPGVAFDAIMSFHVLEHCLFPRLLCREFTNHLVDRGRLHIEVPEQDAEPTMGVLLFLPHLHSYTASSLMHLCLQAGLDVREYDAENGNLSCTAIKTDFLAHVPDTPPERWRTSHRAKFDRAIGAGLHLPAMECTDLPFMLWSGYRESPRVWAAADSLQVDMVLAREANPRLVRVAYDHSSLTGEAQYELIAPHLYVK